MYPVYGQLNPCLSHKRENQYWGGVSICFSPQTYDCGGSSCHLSLCTCVSSRFSIVVISKWQLIQFLPMQQEAWGCSRCMLQLPKMSTGHRELTACRPRHAWLRRICQKVCCSVLLECLCSIFFQGFLPNSKIAQMQSYCTGRGSCFLATAEGESFTEGSLVLASPSIQTQLDELYWI